MEGLPSKIEKIEVIRLLKERGLDNPQTRELLMEWTIEQEIEVEIKNNPAAQINFTIDRTEMYLAIGDIEGALDTLDDARRQALQENETDLYNKIMNKMGEI